MFRPSRSVARSITSNVLIVFAGACSAPLVSCGARPAVIQHAVQSDTHASLSLSCLIVGGGPERKYNQVALENNVRYVSRTLPPSSQLKILFADGAHRERNVQYTDSRGTIRYRKTVLKQIDGPSSPAMFSSMVRAINVPSTSPLLLYFTGHGSPDDGDYTNNDYDMWNDEALSVSSFRTSLSALPDDRPKVAVMVECFSGAFSDLVFAGTPPAVKKPAKSKGAPPNDTQVSLPSETRPLRPNFCGFFASLANREAAGCTPEVNEAEYRDFTSYFFAALSGRDRLGRKVTGADFNRDGRVGMDEAYAYTLLNDVSIDTPLCTSDTFLRSICNMKDEDIFAIPYSTVLREATPAQATVLVGLSRKLSLTREDRLKKAYDEMGSRTQSEDQDEESEEKTALWIRFVRTAKTVVLTQEIMQHGTPQRQAEFKRLIQMEQSSLPLVGA